MIPAAPALGPDEARERILEELSKAEYDDSPGFVAWLLGTIEDWLNSLMVGIDGSSASQAVIVVLVVLALVAVVVLVLRRTGMLRRSPSLAVEAALDAEPVLSAEELRGAARTAIDAGRVDDVRDLEERTLLDVATGMTAHEAAQRATASFPDLRGRLQRGADAFDTAAYSVRSAGPKQAEDLLRLAEYIAETAPDLAASAPQPASVASSAGTGDRA
jgi:hypothetical protein